MQENRPEKKVPNPKSVNHGDLVQFLRENGITTLDDLVEQALQQAQSADVEAQLWIAVTSKYVLLGPD